MPDTTTVLVVEDNQITRKMLRVTLEVEGYRVLEADGRAEALARLAETTPHIVLMDLGLADVRGVDLVKQLREMPPYRKLPILAVTGYLSHLEDTEVTEAGFSGIVVKPVEPADLVSQVRRLLGEPAEGGVGPLKGLHVLLVDDDATQRKLERLLLESAGCEITEAEHGEAALELARGRVPDVILSDVLMPVMDGFQLCAHARRDSRLRDVPVVLQSAHFASAEDRRIAAAAGAFEILVRDRGDRGPLVDALARAVRDGATNGEPWGDPSVLRRAYTERLARHVELLASENSGLVRRAALKGAALTALSTVAEVIGRSDDVHKGINEVLQRCADAAGLSEGAVFLRRRGEDAFDPIAMVGFAKGGVGSSLDGPLREAIAGTSPLFLTPVAGKRSTLEALDRLGASSLVLAPIRRNGESLGALVLASAAEVLDGPDWALFAQAIADHLAQALAMGDAFTELKASEARYRTLVEDAPFGIYRSTEAGEIVDANLTFARMLGYDTVEELHESVPDMRGLYVDPAIRDEHIRRHSTGKPMTGIEVQWRRKDGQEITVRLSGTRVGRDDPASATTFHMVAEDVTKLHVLETQLEGAQRLEAIGQLAAGIAHDFNNLMTVVSLNAELALFRVGEDGPADELREAIDAVGRGRSLTQQLLAFGRKQPLELRVVEFAGVLQEIEQMVRRTVPESIDLTFEAAPAGRVLVDPVQFQSVILNLVINARDAMPDGGSLQLRTSTQVFGEDDVWTHVGAEQGAHAVLTVSDTGCGMDEDTRRRIFQPFFTTKTRGRGTGLGLAMAYGTMRQSGGGIEVESVPDQGTTFTLFLPNVDAPVEGSTVHEAGDLDRCLSVLVVEDDGPVRRGVVKLLEKLGHEVEGVSAPRMALAILEARAFDVLATDLVMPDMNGFELAAGARTIRPEQPVVFMSGYSANGVGRITDRAAYLRKPFTLEDLSAKIGEVIA